MSSHPAYAEERKRLTETEGVIESLLISEREEAKETKARLMEAFKYKRDDANALYIAQVLYDRAEQQVKNLTAAGLVPYFTRIDFTEKHGDSYKYYIGKHGVMRPNSFDMEVVDWRSPVANLYYSGQVGPMHYKAPDGEIEGELTLKRQIGIENGELMSIFDTDVVSQEKYLQDVLGEAKGDRLRDIVTTIQAEQNFVIRYDLKKNLVVQGVAGSGKTTIALHRIAYLLYSFQDTLYPEQVAILAPNPLFLNFIAGVLPDLGVERVRQTTYYSFVYDCFDEKVPLLIPNDRTAELVAMEPAEREKRMRILSDKGSLSFAERLEKFLHVLEEEQPPKEDLHFGPVTLFTAAELHKMFNVDNRRIPLLKRREEFKKLLKVKVADAAKQVCDWLESETVKRASFMRSTLPEGTDKQMRMRKLYDSRDQRIAETKKRASTYPNTVMDGLTEYQPLDVYRRFLEAEANETAEYTLKNLENGLIEQEDIAPLGLICLFLSDVPMPDIKHIVIDEAQDFSPLEYLLLKKLCRAATFTVVGDLMQGIRSYRGMTDWNELADGVLEGKCMMHSLVTSYRNTIEIMNTAMIVADKHPVSNQGTIKPVLRHGKEPEILAFSSKKEQTAEIRRLLDEWKQEGMTTVAIIDRTLDKLKNIGKALDGIDVRLLDVQKGEYGSGVYLAKAEDIKGFEFDGVILADASEEAFPDTELDSRILYVCLTRPLHRLAILHGGQLTSLLKKEE